jgi:hypothetical protein
MGMVTMLLGIAKISYGCGPIQPDRNVVREALDLEENGPDEGDIYSSWESHTDRSAIHSRKP